MNVGIFLGFRGKVPIGRFFHVSELDYVALVSFAGIEGFGVKRGDLIHCLCVERGREKGGRKKR